jgi:hypothetical protein
MSPTPPPPEFFKFCGRGLILITLLMIKSLAGYPGFRSMVGYLPLICKPPFFRRRTAGFVRTVITGGKGCRRKAGGKGLPCLSRRGGRQGEGVGKPRHGKGRHGAREAAGRGNVRAWITSGGRTARADGAESGLASARRGGTGRKGERGRADGKAALKANAGACAARLHGCELGKRKAPHGAGLVRFTGRRGIMPAGAGAGLNGCRQLDHANGKGRPIYRSKRQAGAAAPAATGEARHGPRNRLPAIRLCRNNGGNRRQGRRHDRLPNPKYIPVPHVRKPLP